MLLSECFDSCKALITLYLISVKLFVETTYCTITESLGFALRMAISTTPLDFSF